MRVSVKSKVSALVSISVPVQAPMPPATRSIVGEETAFTLYCAPAVNVVTGFVVSMSVRKNVTRLPAAIPAAKFPVKVMKKLNLPGSDQLRKGRRKKLEN